MRKIVLRVCSLAVIVFILLINLLANSIASEEKRQGIFFALGVEPGIANTQSVFNNESIISNFDDIDLSFSLNYKIGYGLTDQLLFYMIGRSSLTGLYSYRLDSNDLDRLHTYWIDNTTGLGCSIFLNKRVYLGTSLGIAMHTSPRYFESEVFENISFGLGTSGEIGYKAFSFLYVAITVDYRRYPRTVEFSSYDNYGNYRGKDTLDFTLDKVSISLAFNYLFY